MHALAIEKILINGDWSLRISGQLTVWHAQSVEKLLAQMMPITLDLTALRYADEAGVHIIWRWLQADHRRSVHISERWQQWWTVTGLIDTGHVNIGQPLVFNGSEAWQPVILAPTMLELRSEIAENEMNEIEIIQSFTDGIQLSALMSLPLSTHQSNHA